MLEKVTAGATAALGNIEMEGFSLDNFTALSLSITNSAIESLGEINLSGFDKDNISSEIISAINVVSNSGKMKQTPILTEIKSISTPTTDNTPIYTFSSSKAGLITYGGMCSSDTTLANKDNNTITLNFLSDGTYSNCTINVTDNNSKKGNTLFLKLFTIDTNVPILLQKTPVTSPTNDATPSYSFNSNEAGTISYGGSCSSETTSASSGTNTIIFDSLSDGSHDCTITITDSAGNASSALSVNTFVVDTVAPIISQSMAVTTPTIDTTPNYIFTSTEAGTINYGGSCSSRTTLATSGNVSITFEALSEGSYSDCTISITDSAGNKSNTLSINSFIITSVIEIEQTNEGDGYFTGSFEVPEEGISFLLSTFKDNNSIVGFYSLTDPDGINILSSSSSLLTKYPVAGDGYANVLVPQSPDFSAKSGTWKFESNNNDRVKLLCEMVLLRLMQL